VIAFFDYLQGQTSRVFTTVHYAVLEAIRAVYAWIMANLTPL